MKRYTLEIDELRKSGDDEDVLKRLQELIEASEAQNEDHGDGVCPWYYAQLATAYRENERYVEELKTLQRFSNQAHPKHASAGKLKQRLQSARSDAVSRARERIEAELTERAAQGQA
jgi:hypothetical protein